MEDQAGDFLKELAAKLELVLLIFSYVGLHFIEQCFLLKFQTNTMLPSVRVIFIISAVKVRNVSGAEE